MIKAKLEIDYSLFEKKMGMLGTKVIPYAKVTAQELAMWANRMVRIFTLRYGTRTKGRKKIADLWELSQTRKPYMDIYIIRNLYPNQDVISIFEEGAMVHNIPESGKKLMHWVDSETGEERYAMKVHHPGVPGTHMIERTVQAMRPKLKLWSTKTMNMADVVMRLK